MTTITSFKKATLALGVALAFAAGSAGATTANLATNGSPTFMNVIGNSFDDILNFNLAVASSTDAGGSSSSFTINFGPWSYTIPAVTFTSVSLFKDGNSAALWTLSPNSSDFSHSDTLGAGHYHFELSGTANGAGTYVTALSAAPVPEPGEWVMILAGLGLVGMMARRRSLKG